MYACQRMADDRMLQEYHVPLVGHLAVTLKVVILQLAALKSLQLTKYKY